MNKRALVFAAAIGAFVTAVVVFYLKPDLVGKRDKTDNDDQ